VRVAVCLHSACYCLIAIMNTLQACKYAGVLGAMSMLCIVCTGGSATLASFTRFAFNNERRTTASTYMLSHAYANAPRYENNGSTYGMAHCTSLLCDDVMQHQVLRGRRLLGRLGPRRASKHLLHSGKLATNSSANSTSNSAANSAANSRHNSASQLHQHQQQQQQQQQLELSPDQHHKHHIRLSDSGGTRTCVTSYCLLRSTTHRTL
jgi:hypothetical protein